MAALTPLEAAVARLSRAMALTDLAMTLGQPAASFARANLPALRSACDAVEAAAALDPHQIVTPPTSVVGPHTAEAIADAITDPTPDTLPDSWKD
jgi:hypothetical protein